jgi:hypothetical protein
MALLREARRPSSWIGTTRLEPKIFREPYDGVCMAEAPLKVDKNTKAETPVRCIVCVSIGLYQYTSQSEDVGVQL